MTASVLTSPTVISSCPKRWCLAFYGCGKSDPGNLRLHEGRTSSVRTLDPATTVDVTPYEQDEQDGTVYTGPMVVIALDADIEISIDLTVDTALKFSSLLSLTAAGDVEVGAEFTLAGSYAPDEFSAATVTIRRIDDVTFDYGSSGRPYTYGAVELAVYDPDNGPKPVSVVMDAPSAAGFARYVAAAAVEVESPA